MAEQEMLQRALLAVHAAIGPGKPFFVAIGLPTEQGTLTGGNTGIESQMRLLRGILESFEHEHAKTLIDGPVDALPLPHCRTCSCGVSQ